MLSPEQIAAKSENAETRLSKELADVAFRYAIEWADSGVSNDEICGLLMAALVISSANVLMACAVKKTQPKEFVRAAISDMADDMDEYTSAEIGEFIKQVKIIRRKMLTPAQIDARRGKLTASRVACLMRGDTSKIMELYLEMTNDPAFVEEDFSAFWPVQLGSATEALNAAWFDRKHGPISRCGEVVVHPNGWAACTLDLWSDLHGCAGECKHTGGHEPFETLVERYQPQLHHIMNVTNTKQCALSVIMGAREPIVEFIDYDEEYGAELMRRATAFMECVRTKTPPVDIDEPVAPPVPGKVYSFEGNNYWACEATQWLENVPSKKIAEAAEKNLKAMVPADAKKCEGHGVRITRDRGGRLSLRQEEETA